MSVRALVCTALTTTLAALSLACARPSSPCGEAEAPGPVLAEPEGGLVRVEDAAPPERIEEVRAWLGEVAANRAQVEQLMDEAESALEARDGAKAVAILATSEPVFIALIPLFSRTLREFDPALVGDLFELAWLSDQLQYDLRLLVDTARFNEAVLSTQASGPSNFVVVDAPTGGALLVELVTAICDKLPPRPAKDLDTSKLRRCVGNQVLRADAFVVRAELGGPTQLVMASEAQLLLPAGPIYTYAVGMSPGATALSMFDLFRDKIHTGLGDMAALEAKITAALGPAPR